MFFHPDVPLSVGFKLEGCELRSARLSKKGGKLELLGLSKQILEKDHVNPLYNPRQHLTEGLEDPFIVSSLDSSQVLVRSLSVPLKKEEDVLRALPFQVESILPFPIEDAFLENILFDGCEEGTSVTALAVKKEQVESHLKDISNSSLAVEKLSCDPLALSALMSLYPEEKAPLLLLYVGGESSTSVLVKEGKLLASRYIGEGSGPDGPQASLIPELSRNLQAMIAASSNDAPVKLLLLGASAEGVKEGLSAQLKLAIELPKDIPGVATGEEVGEYAIPLGLALQGLESDKNPQNFLKGDFEYPKPWKRIKKKVVQYLVLSCVTAFLLNFGLGELQKSKIREIKAEYARALQLAGDSQSRKPRTLYDVRKGIDDLERLWKREGTPLQLHPPVPLVSDVIAWLSEHPLLKKGLEGGASLESLHYNMVTRPEGKKRGAQYLVKIDMTIRAQDGHKAREFYESLQQVNPIVDSSKEVKWEVGKENYKLSFFLKNQRRKS